MALDAARVRPGGGRWWLLVSLASVVGGLLFLGWWAGNWQVARADAEMRENLLGDAVGIAATVNPELASKLTFTAADTGTSAFQRLREQMIQAAATIPKLRSIYSVAARGEKIVFGPDNLADDDEDHAPPGDEYEVPPVELQQALRDGKQVTVGPYTDEWGSFVSAFAPVLDPRSGDVLMVVGVDVEADDWQASLAAVRRSPVLAVLALLAVLASGTLAMRFHTRRLQPGVVRFKVWIAVPTATAALGALTFLALYRVGEFREESRRDMLRVTEAARNGWNRYLGTAGRFLQEEADHLAGDPAILKAWQARDLTALTALVRPAAEQLKVQLGITDLDFIAPDRTCVLRANAPEMRGDRIECTTLLTAERTGEVASGVEMGAYEALTLWHVRPLKPGGVVIGYLKLGMEVNYLTERLSREMHIEVVTALRKSLISRERFEAGRKAFGFVGEWDAYPDFVVAHQTLPELPGGVADWLEHGHLAATGRVVFDARQGNKELICAVIHLVDAAGRKVVDLIVMRDVTAEIGATRSALLLRFVLVMVLFGGVLALLWSVTGVAERQLATGFDRVRESEERFRSFYENLPVGLYRTTPDGRIVMANPCLVAMLGYGSFEELLAHDLGEAGFGSTSPRVRFVEAIERDGKVEGWEASWTRRGGTTIDVRESARVIRDGTGRSLFYEGAVEDITRRKQAEQALADSQAQLVQAQKMEAVGRLAGGVAHDFNNILQALTSLATVLRLRAPSPELARTVAEIEALIKRGGGLTQQLLLFSRREISKAERLDLGELVGTVAVLLRRLIPASIRLTVETTPELLWVEGDAGQIQQVIMNLAVNSRDAMPSGGTLTVRAFGTGGDAVLEVADTGHGMDEQTRVHLFEPFFTTKERGKGTGLGLSVVHGIVKQHGGRIEVDSSPGSGSRFRVVLPAALTPVEKSGAAACADSGLPSGHGEHILVVEDEEGARSGLVELLEYLGYEVTARSSGEEAGILPADMAPVLLLTDLMLPGVTGSDLAVGLQDRWPGLKVILMSGYTEDEAVRRDVDKGKVRFLQKPFDMAALAREMRAALDE